MFKLRGSMWVIWGCLIIFHLALRVGEYYLGWNTGDLDGKITSPFIVICFELLYITSIIAIILLPMRLISFPSYFIRNFLPMPRKYLSIVILLSISLIIMCGYWKIQQDDSYIFYAYANNIANGHGYVFNIGEKCNATTSPLYTLLLACIYQGVQFLPFVTLPLIGHLIGGICLFLISFFLMQSVKRAECFITPLILPLVFLSSPLLTNAIGMESLLAMMFAVMSLYMYSCRKLLVASLACSLAVLSRPDMALLAIVLLGDFSIRRRCFPSFSMIMIFLSPILVWLLFSLIYFGEIMPSTLSAKLGQTDSGRWGTGLIFLKGILSKQIWHGTQNRDIVTISALLSTVMIFLHHKHWQVFRHPMISTIILWNLLYLVVYGLILNPPAYPWYYTPLALGFAALVASAVEMLVRFHAKSGILRVRVFIVIFYLALGLTSLVLPLKILKGPVTKKYARYKLVAEWLNAHVPSGSSVGANEIGVLRYFYKGGTVIDGLGLVTSGVATHVKRRDYNWYVHQYTPDYLMFNHPHRPVLEEMVDEVWFQKEYALQIVIKDTAVYTRRSRDNVVGMPMMKL